VAREVIEKLIDDLDGGDAAETVTFGLDGTSYEIDLSKRNAAAMRKSLARYVAAARRTSGSRSRPSVRRDSPPTAKRSARKRSTSAKRDYDLAALREWAAANDVVVPSRGRIPQATVDHYKAAGGR